MLGRRLLLFEFELPSEVERVLARDKRSIKENFLILDRWNIEVGCLCKDSYAKEAWVRMVGFPLHLWSWEVFKKIGDGCGGFIAVDEDTTFFIELQWARILVKLAGRDLPSTAQIVVGWGAMPFNCGGKLHLILCRWCRREENAGWANQGSEKKRREIYALLAMGVKGRRWSN